jgi:hypothetical protein
VSALKLWCLAKMLVPTPQAKEEAAAAERAERERMADQARQEREAAAAKQKQEQEARAAKVCSR